MDISTLREQIAPLARDLQALCEQGVRDWEPKVEEIIAAGCPNRHEVERTFDHLLDLCQHKDGLRLFKRLGRAYWETNPQVVAFYVNAYRELWGSDEN